MAAEPDRRGIERDNLNEFLYRRLFGWLLRHVRHAEALNAYRHCRELLSIGPDVSPSAETESLIKPTPVK